METPEKKQLTTEEALKALMLDDDTDIDQPATVDRFVDLLIDLIAERSEEKAQEILDDHEIDYDHNQMCR